MKTYTHMIRAILLVSVIAGIMSLVRFVLAGHESYLWLNWNLLLALLPIGFAWLSLAFKKKWIASLMVFLWLGFLPNAPYLITDFIHLDVVGPDSLLWYDGMMIFMYSVAGVAAWVLSLKMVVRKYQWKSWVVWFIALLTGFGVYLGRYIRFNTWDIITNPGSLLSTIGEVIILPQLHRPVISMTLVFAVALVALYTAFGYITKHED